MSIETQNSLLGLLAYLGRDRPKIDLESTCEILYVLMHVSTVYFIVEEKEEEMAAAVSEAVKVAEEAVEAAEGLKGESEQLNGDTEDSFFDKSLEELPDMVIPEWRLDRKMML